MLYCKKEAGFKETAMKSNPDRCFADAMEIADSDSAGKIVMSKVKSYPQKLEKSKNNMKKND